MCQCVGFGQWVCPSVGVSVPSSVSVRVGVAVNMRAGMCVSPASTKVVCVFVRERREEGRV